MLILLDLIKKLGTITMFVIINKLKMFYSECPQVRIFSVASSRISYCHITQNEI